MKRNLQYILLLLIILGIATFFRFYNLDNIPPGIYPDEAINANQAISEPGKIFYPENNGREGFFINLIYLSFSLFGISIWSFKFISALIGVLTVIGLYFLTKEILSRNIALLSSFFLALSFWHINFSRIAFRAILVPFCLVFLFYFLFRGFRTKKFSNFILSGLFFGLGFHTYIAFRLVVLLVLLILIPWWLIYKKENQQKRFFIFIACWLLATFFVALPIGIYFLNNPQDFMSRAGGVSVFSQDNPLLALIKSSASHILTFNFFGDFNWRHNISGKPVLFWPVGILFLIGLIFCIRKVLKVFKGRNWTSVVGYWLLLSWWLIMLLPGALSCEGIPHSLRIIGAIPPVFILAGIGGVFLWKKVKLLSRSKLPIWLIACLFIILTTSFIYVQYWRYFILWGMNTEVEGAFSKDYVSIGNYLNSLPETTKKYVIVNQSGVLVKGIPMPAQTVMFIEKTKSKETQTIYLLPEDMDQIKIEKQGVIALMRYDENLFNQLLKKFPSGEIIQKNEVKILKINH